MSLWKCKICKKGIIDYPSRARVYCSSKCFKIGTSKRMMGHKLNVGRKQSKTEREMRSKIFKGKRLNEENPNWKGNKVRYQALHQWVRRHLGTPEKCDGKNCSGKSRRYHWANISGKYKRSLKDWVRLCVSCHLKMDWQRSTHDKQRIKLKKIMLGNKHASKKTR